jgi:hypothetical protein
VQADHAVLDHLYQVDMHSARSMHPSELPTYGLRALSVFSMRMAAAGGIAAVAAKQSSAASQPLPTRSYEHAVPAAAQRRQTAPLASGWELDPAILKGKARIPESHSAAPLF